ncbi:hypothetical protein Q3G72_003449 [Acer saccharum]|nr:hypothetical protein Q3G72_003449 [Acer saccharum]
MGHSYSFRHKLWQGEELKDGDEQVSASGKFKFGFFTPSSTPYSSKCYVRVWYNKPTDRTNSLYNEDEIDWNGSLRDDRGQSIASCSVFNLGKRKSA